MNATNNSNVTFYVEGGDTENLLEYWPAWLFYENNIDVYLGAKEVREEPRVARACVDVFFGRKIGFC